MQVLLKVDGWKKFIDVDEIIAETGIINVDQYHPFFAKLRPKKEMDEVEISVLTFVFTGKETIDGIPIFECED